jgi:putative hydrolase of the HAD superfamily
MVGNSLRSDILPLVELGANAIYVPYESTWAHENQIEGKLDSDSYYEIEKINHAINKINLIKLQQN